MQKWSPEAYRIELSARESTLTVRHLNGKGYYLKTVTLSNDLTSPAFELSDDVAELDAFVSVPCTLPYGTVTDNDANARMTCAVVSDNASFAQITGSGTQEEPFLFTATQEGEYTVERNAADEGRRKRVYRFTRLASGIPRRQTRNLYW